MHVCSPLYHPIRFHARVNVKELAAVAVKACWLQLSLPNGIDILLRDSPNN